MHKSENRLSTLILNKFVKVFSFIFSLNLLQVIKCSDISDITHEEEETYACATAAKRADTPRKNLFVDLPYPEHDQSKVKEPGTWCRLKFDKSFCLNPPIRRAPEEIVDIEDVE